MGQAHPPLILAGLDILHKDRLKQLKMASLANPSGPIQVPKVVGDLVGQQFDHARPIGCTQPRIVLGSSVWLEGGPVVSLDTPVPPLANT